LLVWVISVLNTTEPATTLVFKWLTTWPGSIPPRSRLAGSPMCHILNLSGKAVRYWLDKENIAPRNLLVILDDLAIPLSKLRLRPSGSDGGHNGLKSIQESMATVNYPRLRFGIGASYPKGGQVEFVLGKWDEAEIPVVEKKVEKAAEVVETYVLRGLEPAMNEVNKMDFGT